MTYHTLKDDPVCSLGCSQQVFFQCHVTCWCHRTHHARERPAWFIITKHPTQGRPRKGIFRWNVICRLRGRMQNRTRGSREAFWGVGAPICCFHRTKYEWQLQRMVIHLGVPPRRRCANMVDKTNLRCYSVWDPPNVTAINCWDDSFTEALVIFFPQSFFVDTKSTEKLIREIIINNS